MVTIYNTTLSATSQRHFSDGLGGGAFSEPFPARSAFAVKDLPKGAQVEIEVVAAK